MTTAQLPCLRIDCPEWYEREDFIQWLQAGVGKGLATWHVAGEVGDMSDVFLVYDNGECGDLFGFQGSDVQFPDDLWAEVRRRCDEAGVEYGLVWLTNVE
jgi:hypothetical protein